MLVLTELQADRIAEQRRRDEFFWLDLTDPSDAELDTVGELLDLHPIALEDSREFGQRPKMDVYESHLLLVFYSARVAGDGPARPIEVHLHLSGSFVVTIRRSECAALEDLHVQLETTPTEDEG